jgi:hypothetical protein|tara:strand:+ start:302 stop:466 length:165 start_codon:yes stop_codon:yes gene_type:complete
MDLHARNVAMGADVPTEWIPDCVNFMKVRNRINEKAAITYLKSRKFYQKNQNKN